MNLKVVSQVAALAMLLAASAAVVARAASSPASGDVSAMRTVEPEVFAYTTSAGPPPLPALHQPEAGAESSAPEPSEVLTALERGLHSSVLMSARLGEPPATDSWPGYWFYTTLAIPSATDGAALPAAWEADLLQGDVAEEINARQKDLSNVISGGDAHGILPDGSVVDLGGGAADVAAGQVFPAPAGGSAAIEAHAQAVVRDFGLTLDKIDVLHPLDLALSIEATISDPSAFSGKFPAFMKALEGDPIDIEGVCIQLRGPDGSMWLRQAVAFRNGAGRLWVSPDASTSFATAHG